MGLLGLFSSRKYDARRLARALYDGMMSAALSTQLYTAGVAEDSFDGRFEQVTLHAALLMRRLRQAGVEGRVLADALYKNVFSGFDYALRETGVGDSSISRKVRKLGEEFYGMARGLDEALAADGANALSDFTKRNGLARGPDGQLEAYLRHIDDMLAGQADTEILKGNVNWPAIA